MPPEDPDAIRLTAKRLEHGDVVFRTAATRCLVTYVGLARDEQWKTGSGMFTTASS